MFSEGIYLDPEGNEIKAGAGGEFTLINEGCIIGTFTSATGHTFTIFRQGAIRSSAGSWSDKCNRASQISVCSGYYSGNPLDLIEMVPSSAPWDSSLYSRCGLYYTTGQYNLNTIRDQVSNGGQVIMYLTGYHVGRSGISKYGRKWAGYMHWIAILGYRTEGGKEEIFVSDSGWGNSGWWPIDEFDGIVYNNSMILIHEK